MLHTSMSAVYVQTVSMRSVIDPFTTNSEPVGPYLCFEIEINDSPVDLDLCFEG